MPTNKVSIVPVHLESTLVKSSTHRDLNSDAIFLFSALKCNRYKCIYFNGEDFSLLYKRLDNGRLQWIKDEVWNVTYQKLL